MRQRIWPDRFRLDLRTDHEGRVPARFEIDISLMPRFAVRVRSARNWRSHGWGLTAGLPRVAKDPFREAQQWTYRALVQVLPRKSRDAPHLRLGTRWIDPVLAKTLLAVRAQIRQAALRRWRCSKVMHERLPCGFPTICGCGCTDTWQSTPRAGWRNWHRHAPAR
jgi:hypothetical protein